MANQTAARSIQRGPGQIAPYFLTAATKIFAGGAVVLDNTSRFAIKAGDIANAVFVGVADKTADNTNGANGAKKVRCWRTGVFNFNATGANQTWVGKPAFFTDDNTVSTTATTNNIKAGVVTEVVNATTVFVAITPVS